MFRTSFYASAFAVLTCLFAVTGAKAQARTSDEINFLAERILEHVPDIPSTRGVFGTRGERIVHAREHAAAIMRAADLQASRWESFSIAGHWSVFNPRRDLPALIASIAYRESMFNNVVRLDDGTRVYELPFEYRTDGSRRLRRIATSDIGIMQVRAPSRNAAVCGVSGPEETARLLADIQFNYEVGACVLTNVVGRVVSDYADPRDRMLRTGLRPTVVLRFFGAYGPREGTLAATRAQELILIERYNWGSLDLHMHETHGFYAYRVLRIMEEFAPPFDELTGG